MLNGARSALEADDRSAHGNEVYGARLHLDFKRAVQAIESALTSRKEGFTPIT